MRLRTKRLKSGKKMLPIYKPKTGQILNKADLGIGSRLKASKESKQIVRERAVAKEFESDITRFRSNAMPLIGESRRSVHPQHAVVEVLGNKLRTKTAKGKISLESIKENRNAYYNIMTANDAEIKKLKNIPKKDRTGVIERDIRSLESDQIGNLKAITFLDELKRIREERR